MAVRKFKPITPGQRHKVAISFDTITKSKPEKSLLVPNHRSGGRNDTGKMTIANVGGGHKKKYRLIDFKREKLNVPAKVASIEYDKIELLILLCFIIKMVKKDILLLQKV